MKCPNQSDYKLYFVTDRNLMTTSTLDEAVVKAIEGGITMLQLREKEISSRSFYEEALRIKTITDQSSVPLLLMIDWTLH